MWLSDRFLHVVKTVTDGSPNVLHGIETLNLAEADVHSKDISVPTKHITLHNYNQL